MTKQNPHLKLGERRKTDKEILNKIKSLETKTRRNPDKFSRDHLKDVSYKQALEWVLGIE